MAALLLAAALVVPASAQEDAGTLAVAFSRRLISNVDENDALAATKVWIDALTKELGEERIVKAETYLVSGTDDLERLSREVTLDVAVLHPVEYLQSEGANRMEPRFTATRDGETAYGVSLLVHRDSGLERVEDLRGKVLVAEHSNVGVLPDLWMGSIMRARGLPFTTGFFSEVRRVRKVSQSALAVFFGQADACTVKQDSYRTLVELNPQVGEALVPIASSNAFCRTVICVRPTDSSEDSLVQEALASLHQTVRGRQLLHLFSVDQLVPFEDRFLDGVRDLLAEVDPPTALAARPGPSQVAR